jgi:hypothetical protein
MRRIPRRFRLAGQEITVQFVPDLVKRKKAYGRWHSTRNLIELQEPGEDYSYQFILQTFWHEAMHAMLEIAGYEDLSTKEKLVDRMGHMIHQLLATKRGS